MISETGSKRRRSGFTLIEIVLVLGLIALASSVFLVNFNAFNDRRGSTNPSDILRQVIRDARFQAAADRVVNENHLR
jgi:prepilin-type N-terminal cleavage/methylation domain